jgi:2-alkyl-3-oxoalkanoate reductase
MSVLVTGGGGFIGSNLVAALRAQQVQVRSLARSEHTVLSTLGVEQMRGDVTDPTACDRALVGVDVVFHVAARASMSVRLEPFLKTNLEGTRTLLQAAQRSGVKRFVYTSTPSVVFSKRGHEGASESAPLVQDTFSPYAYSKARAEELVLGANRGSFRTVALRPHLVWGPGDTQLTARLVARAKAGKLKLVGDGSAQVDTTYIDNCVDAHLAAERALQDGRGQGKAFFISNDEPVTIRAFVDAVLRAHSLEPRYGFLSPSVAVAVGAVFETAYRLVGSDAEPLLTRFIAVNLSTPHWFDLSAAKTELSYRPQVTLAQGFERLAASVREGAPSR